MDEKQEKIAMGATMIARRHVAMAMDRKGLKLDTEAPTYMPVGQVMAVSPQPAPPAPAPVATAPAPAPKVNPWRRVVDSYNGAAAAEKPKSSAWSAAVARLNERLASS